MPQAPAPLLILGAGRMGGALIAGWMRTGAFPASELMVRDPHPGAQALAAVVDGARLGPTPAEMGDAPTVILAVKPQAWREVAAEAAAHLSPSATIISIMAGVEIDAITQVLGARPVARAMPSLAASIGEGATCIFSPDPGARARARALFAPLGAVVDLAEEAQLHAATAVAGSGPAYLYAFVEALGAAGEAEGLDPATAAALAAATVTGAAALLAQGNVAPAELRRQVTSPGGTTEAALRILAGPDGLDPLLARAAAAAAARSRQLSGPN